MNQASVIPFPQREANNRPIARERITPQSLESEQSTLGAMMMERDAIARAIESLSADDFYRELHRKIFMVIIGLFDKGEPVDLITVVEELRRKGQLEEVGGAAYLTALIEACPSAANVESYAKVVVEKSVLRQLLKASEAISGDVYNQDSDDIHDLVDKSEKRIFEIGSRQLRDGFSHIKPLLMSAYDQIERQFQRKGEATGVSTGFADLDDITSGLQQTDLIIVAARPSMGKCGAHWTLIDDPQTGERLTLEECVQRRVSVVTNLSRTGQLQTTPVSDWIDSGVKPVWKITTRLGRHVEVTGHHPFLAVKGWTPLHDLKVGDKIAVPRSVPVFGNDTSWSIDRVRLLAYFIAEGCLTGGSPNFTNTDPVLVDDFSCAIKREFDNHFARKKGERPAYDIVQIARPFSKNIVKAWLDSLGLWGHKAKTKFFPAAVWTWDRSRLAEFLRVLFSCDGTIYKLGNFPRIEFSVASEKLAEDVQHALLRFGIIAKLWRKKSKFQEKYFDSWRVEITDPRSVLIYQAEIGWVGEKAGRLSGQEYSERALPTRQSNTGHPPGEVWELVQAAASKQGLSLVELARRAGETEASGRFGGYNPHTNRSLPRHRLARYAEVLQDTHLLRVASEDIYWDEIVSIEAIGEHQVYDLTVPDGSNFIAQDICVHNTALCLNIAHHIALKERLPVAVFSLEMSKEQLVQRLICSEASINSRDMRRGFLQDSDWHRVTDAVNKLYQAPIFIDDTPGASTFEMRAKARRLTAEHGQLGLIVVDYLQLAHHGGKNENRVQEISEIARSFKSMARELKCPLIALSQLSRAVEQREDKRPILSDLRESGSIEAEADVVAFIYRPSYYKNKIFNKEKGRGEAVTSEGEPDPDEGIAEIIIGKQRNGPTGTVRLGFQPEHARFTNLAHDEYQSYD
jgi:replicative DNA helicase